MLRICSIILYCARYMSWRITDRFLEGICKIPEVTVYGDFEGEHASIVTINVRGFDSAVVSDILAQEYGIATRPGAHCAPRMHEALGTVETGAVRFGFGYYNTEEEVDAALEAIREIVRFGSL